MSISLTLRVFVPFALGYFLASTFRSINSVIAPDLVRDLGLSASQLGFAVSAFFLCATLMQIPYGILLDRYDPRRVYAGFLVLCALGSVISAFADGIAMLALGRAFIALGTTASAVTSFKVFSMWYPRQRLAMANGLALAAGGLGVMAGTAPVELALTVMDWRDLHLVLAALVAAGAGAALAVAPVKQTPARGATLVQQIRGLGTVLKSRAFWTVAPLMMANIGVYAGFPALWTGPWVRDVGGFSDIETANLLMAVAAGLTVAGAGTGIVLGLARRAGLTPMGVVVAAALTILVLVVTLSFQTAPAPALVAGLWVLFGFVAPLNMITYAALGSQFPAELAGRLNACLTLSWFLGAFLTQNIYGWALDRYPSQGGHYAVEGHRLGMGIMAAILVVALAWTVTANLIFKNR